MKTNLKVKFLKNKFVSYRQEKFDGKKVILVGLPLTHSLFILEGFEIFVWNLCDGKTSLNKILKKVSEKYGKDYKKRCILFLKEMLRKKVVEKVD